MPSEQRVAGGRLPGIKNSTMGCGELEFEGSKRLKGFDHFVFHCWGPLNVAYRIAVIASITSVESIESLRLIR